MHVVVLADQPDTRPAAEALAERLGLECLPSEPAPAEVLRLAVTAAGLELREGGGRAAGPVRVDFRPGRGSSLLRRATLAGKAGVSRLIDATAGLGQDAFAVAETGVTVELLERSPIVAALLADGIARALELPGTREAALRMRLHSGDAKELLPALAPADVVYLDPMYPRSGREGGKAKEMRILRALLGGDSDAGELLQVARLTATRRVTVKRPLRAPPLAGSTPSGSLEGTTVRYDLYGPAAKL